MRVLHSDWVGDNDLVETVVPAGIVMIKEILFPHGYQLSGARQEHDQEGEEAATHHTVAWTRNI